MNNMDEVRANLTSIFDGLKAATLKHADAREMNNACGKVINTVKVELEYYALLKKQPNIPFLGRQKTLPNKPSKGE